jgi:hypothetical protein
LLWVYSIVKSSNSKKSVPSFFFSSDETAIILTLRGLSLTSALASILNAASYKPEYKLSLVVGPTNPWSEGATKFAGLLVITYIPSLSLYLPGLFGLR